MLDTGRRTSKSLAWLPGPSTKPNLSWILMLTIDGLLAEASDRVTPFAAQIVISQNWQMRLRISSTMCSK